MSLQTLHADCPQQDILAAMTRDGACILAGVADADTVKQLRDELAPFIALTPMGADDFSGRKTQRTGALVARTPSCRPLVVNSIITGAARAFLKPWAERILLHLTQTIYIHPGQGAQTLHRDRLAWGTALQPPVEPQFNSIWALTDFTAENGATRVVPGSQTWPWEQRAPSEMVVQAEMSAGSVLLYTGSVLHSGGQNRSNVSRLGLNITYCLGWLRQEENQYLSCPPHIARHLEPELQELLGYTQGNYALGYYSDPDATEPGRDILPPEFALGRKPRKGQGFSMPAA